jgi:PAS domain S-box-containing protein
VDREREGTADREPADDDEGYFRFLVDGVPDAGLSFLDPTGRVLTWSVGAERITGYGPDEMVGRSIARSQSPAQAAGDDRTVELVGATAEGNSREQGWWVRKDGTRFWAEVTVTALRGPAGEVRGFAHVVRDLTELTRREHELEEQVRRLADSSRRKDELLSLMAHQLRNPLTPIRNSLHLLRRGPGDPRLATNLYELMDRQVDRLARIVDDVLEISRLARGLIVLERQHVDLRQVARQAVEARRTDSDQTGVSLALAMPPAPVWVWAEPERLRRVADALLENAVRSTGRCGSVALEVVSEAEGHRAILAVRDTGMGIAPDMLERLVEALARPDGSLDRGRGGLGLGLALARGIVELHGGTVLARSEGAGLGAEFAMALPLAEQPVAASADRTVGSPRAAARLRILVVEDNADAAESLRRLLRLHGHEVSVTDNGVDGVAEAKRCRPDAVVCDIGLPGMDGYAVASALRGDPETARTRLIAVTGYGRAEDRARALSSGFDDHIVKPADPAVLLSKLAVAPGP